MQWPPPGTEIGVYARFSDDLQNARSADDQLRLADEFAARFGWKVRLRLKDEGISGSNLVGRSAFHQLMAAAANGEIQLILCEHLDRLSRDAADMHAIYRDLKDYEVGLCTVMSGMVTATDLTVNALQNQQYLERLAFGVRRGQESAVLSGRISGSLPYGYEKANTLEVRGLRAVHSKEADVVRRIYADFAAGVSAEAICKALNAEGEPPPKGQMWRSRTLTGNKQKMNGILRNPIYAGRYFWGKSKRKKLRDGRIEYPPTPQESWRRVDIPHLRIVDDDLYEAVQDMLARTAEPERPNDARRPTYLLSGRTFCGVCDAPYATLCDRLGCTGRRWKNDCTNRRRVKREEVEQAVLASLQDELLQPGILDHCIAEYNEELLRAREAFAGHQSSRQARLDELGSEIANLRKAIRTAPAGVAMEMLTADLREAGEEARVLERDLKRTAPMPVNLSPEAVLARLRSFVSDLRDALTGSERDAVRAREVIRSFVDRIIIHPVIQEKEDKRGAGPIRIEVHGRMNTLLDQLRSSREAQGEMGPQGTQDSATRRFRYWIDPDYADARLVGGVVDDLPVIASVLDGVTAPKPTEAMVVALWRRLPDPDLARLGEMRDRARHALNHLRDRGQIRSIKLAGGRAGWVWNHFGLSDQEWKDRAARTPDKGYDLPIVMATAPTAKVVVIGET